MTFEAPGFTWLAAENSNIDISLLDALSLIHENDDWDTEIVKFVAKKIKEYCFTTTNWR